MHPGRWRCRPAAPDAILARVEGVNGSSHWPCFNFSRKELRKAFLDFSKLSKSRPRFTKVQRNFLVYAIYIIECGLKCILPVTRDLKSTNQLGEENLTRDLGVLLSKSKTIDKSPKLFQRMQRDRKSISSKQLYELYRYGG